MSDQMSEWMEDLGWMSSCGKIWKLWRSGPPSRLYSSDFIDLMLMKNNPHFRERQREPERDRGDRRGEGTDNSHRQRGEVEQRAGQRQCWGGDIMMTSLAQRGRGRRSQGSCGWGDLFSPRGPLIWLPGKHPSIAERESHWEGSCPALTDEETNGLWNSISCETHSQGGAAS